jgi:hypothetical protein
MDLMRDTLADRRVFRTLNIVDDYTRECLAVEVYTSLPGRGGAGAGVARSRGATTTAYRRGQRPGVREQDGGSVGGEARHQPPRHRPGQADAEGIRRELQRKVPRRVPEPALVRQPGRGEKHARRVANRLQRAASASELPAPDVGEICGEVQLLLKCSPHVLHFGFFRTVAEAAPSSCASLRAGCLCSPARMRDSARVGGVCRFSVRNRRLVIGAQYAAALENNLCNVTLCLRMGSQQEVPAS